MRVANQGELFSELTDNDNPEVVINQDGLVTHWKCFLTSPLSTFQTLLDTIPWESHELMMFGKSIPQPRLTAWYGDNEEPYTYSGLTLQPHKWTEELLVIKKRCEEVAGIRFNSMLANHYRDGSDSVSWHSDDEPELGRNPTIASISLGAERRFDLRHKETKETVKLNLSSGSLVLMSGECQHNWIHQIAKTKRVSEPRINLTFRVINTPA